MTGVKSVTTCITCKLYHCTHCHNVFNRLYYHVECFFSPIKLPVGTWCQKWDLRNSKHVGQRARHRPSANSYLHWPLTLRRANGEHGGKSRLTMKPLAVLNKKPAEYRAFSDIVLATRDHKSPALWFAICAGC